MKQAVFETVESFKMFPVGTPVVVGVSGGADSMALLHFLLANRDSFNLGEITALHFNHGLRGESSDADERFVQKWCCEHDVPFLSERGNMSNRLRPKGESVESWARTLRYRFLEQVAEQKNAVVAVAHNRDDQAETVLLHLLHGTGIRGMRGILPVRGRIVRPFLSVSRTQIEEYCKDNDIPFVTDETNLDDVFTRNRIRHHILPEMSAVNRGAAEHLSRFAVHALRIHEYLEQQAEKCIQQSSCSDHVFDADAILSEGDVVAGFALKQLCEAHGCDVDETALNLALQVAHGTLHEVQLSKQIYLRQDNGQIYFREPKAPQQKTFEPVVVREGNNCFGKSIVNAHFLDASRLDLNLDRKKYKSLLNNTLDCDKITGCLVIRGRREGDTFTSWRRGHTKSIKKLLQEMSIPSDERTWFPLVCDEMGVVWVPGQGCAARVAPDDTSQNLIHFSLLEEKASCTTTF